MSQAAPPLVLINAVGLTGRLLRLAPRLLALAESESEAGWSRSLDEVLPAVTCSAQATILTGLPPQEHGIVGNGWLFRETGEVRFWQQSSTLIQAEPIYVTARRLLADRGRPFRAAKLFWWFNQGAAVDFSVTPKPVYGADGSKFFGIWGDPPELPARLETRLGPFPFHTFWGPLAGRPCTDWIARGAAEVLRSERPELTLVYLPHLDYDPQRFGPSGSDLPRLVGELDNACAVLLDTAREVGARVWVVSEYGHCDVSRCVLPNRALRESGLLAVRPGPFGDQLETYQSRAFAVCDHQLAHVYVRRAEDLDRVRERLAEMPGVARALVGEERGEIGLNHPRAGEIVLLSKADAWFAYPFWIDDRDAPDYARTVDIHRKPGYDPCELFFDPRLKAPKLHFARKLAAKKLGFRALLDVVPLDPSVVRGSHGLPAQAVEDRPILIGDGPAPPGPTLEMTAVRDLLLEALNAS
ncbi:alkaline phosphatase family protein [soil metagenome]